jgi:hypothetical protein
MRDPGVLDRATLFDNATRYDLMVAKPSDADRMRMWEGRAIISETSAVSCIVVVTAILWHPVMRRRWTNLYLVLLFIPDIVFSALYLVSCALNYSVGAYYGERMCDFQVHGRPTHGRRALLRAGPGGPAAAMH